MKKNLFQTIIFMFGLSSFSADMNENCEKVDASEIEGEWRTIGCVSCQGYGTYEQEESCSEEEESEDFYDTDDDQDCNENEFVINDEYVNALNENSKIYNDEKIFLAVKRAIKIASIILGGNESIDSLNEEQQEKNLQNAVEEYVTYNISDSKMDVMIVSSLELFKVPSDIARDFSKRIKKKFSNNNN